VIKALNRIVKLDPSDDCWEAFVKSFPHANIFHHPSWVNLLADCYGFNPFVFALVNEENNILAGLPLLEVQSYLTGNRWVSLPFTDYCNPLYCDDDALRLVTEELIHVSHIQNKPYTEVRWTLPDNTRVQSESNYVHHTLNLDQEIDTIFSSLHRTQRQNIRTAEKNQVQVVRREGLDAMRVFYQLHCYTRRRHGVPVQPWRFFELLHDRLLTRNLGFISLAYAGKQCLAAGLFLSWNKSLIYKYAASSDVGQDLRPNHLLTWTAINWGCENGYKVLDFGRTDLNNRGLRTFKNRWGAAEISRPYSIISTKNDKPLVRRIPSVINTIIRNSPMWVCRLCGEFLYKHFG